MAPAASGLPAEPLVGRRIAIGGVVQGVGFRPAVFRLASAMGLRGRVANDARGVLIDAFGREPQIALFLDRLVTSPPSAARIRSVTVAEIPPDPPAGFSIDASASGPGRRVAIPPDLPVCRACLREMRDPGDRRFGYAFINCTDCGPRFTIARAVPYDRAATTMAGFAMCAACRAEYEDPRSRRFHAQPNACPACGPRLALRRADGVPVAGDPVDEAARALREGRVVAVKGIGGFHLACDATSEAAVARLRERKRREEKPFAVMVRSLAKARALAALTPEEEALLAAPERPVVLVARRPDAPIAAAVAPDSVLLGLILPYAPLHHLLLAAAGRPLVMTSGNLSEEPIVHEDALALERLAGIADLVLGHDRPIETPCDDSVARVVDGGPMLLRCSRGHVPEPILLARPVVRPVLAVGGHLKNTFCIAAGERATPGPHVGDLENARTFDVYRAGIAKMERFLGVAPEVIAHDLHPGYLSTSYALARPEPAKVGVQHHHAHVAAVMAEHGLEEEVLGLAYDGSGWGPDGASWGGELLLASLAGFRRLATFRAIALPGGEAAIREPWRAALTVLRDAWDGAPPRLDLPLFAGVPAAALAAVAAMLEKGVNVPRAHGVGRWFDAIGALVLGRAVSSYEGQVATLWNLAADPRPHRPYPFTLDARAEPWEVDLRPMVRAIVEDWRDGVGAPAIAARFHETLVAASEALVRSASHLVGRRPVVLGGGCFANPRLGEGIAAALRPDFDVLFPRRVPPGDGGLALGQAVVADAIMKSAG